VTQANAPLPCPHAHLETINYHEQPGRVCGGLLTLQIFKSYQHTGSTKTCTFCWYNQSVIILCSISLTNDSIWSKEIIMKCYNQSFFQFHLQMNALEIME